MDGCGCGCANTSADHNCFQGLIRRTRSSFFFFMAILSLLARGIWMSDLPIKTLPSLPLRSPPGYFYWNRLLVYCSVLVADSTSLSRCRQLAAKSRVWLPQQNKREPHLFSFVKPINLSILYTIVFIIIWNGSYLGIVNKWMKSFEIYIFTYRYDDLLSIKYFTPPLLENMLIISF